MGEERRSGRGGSGRGVARLQLRDLEDKGCQTDALEGGKVLPPARIVKLHLVVKRRLSVGGLGDGGLRVERFLVLPPSATSEERRERIEGGSICGVSVESQLLLLRLSFFALKRTFSSSSSLPLLSSRPHYHSTSQRTRSSKSQST